MITEKDKQKIFDADLSNIVRKVKAGKPLTGSERKIIQATKAPDPNAEKLYSVNALSKVTGKDRRTLDKVLVTVAPAGKGPKGAATYRLADVEAAIANKPDKGMKEEKLAEEIRKLRLANDEAEGKLVPIQAEAAWLYALAKKAQQVLWQKLVNEMPTAVAQLDEPNARAYAKRLYNAIAGELRGIVKDPEQQKMLESHEG